MRAALDDDRILMMELLVAHGADVNAGWNGNYPIICAPCETLAPRALDWLLTHGANANIHSDAYGSPLAMVVATYSRKPAGKHACLGVFAKAGIDLPNTPTMALASGVLICCRLISNATRSFFHACSTMTRSIQKLSELAPVRALRLHHSTVPLSRTRQSSLRTLRLQSGCWNMAPIRTPGPQSIRKVLAVIPHSITPLFRWAIGELKEPDCFWISAQTPIYEQRSGSSLEIWASRRKNGCLSFTILLRSRMRGNTRSRHG